MPVQNGQTWFGWWFIASRGLRVVHGSQSTSRWNPVKSLIISNHHMTWDDLTTTPCVRNFIPLPRSKSFHRGCKSFSKDLGFSTGAFCRFSCQHPEGGSVPPKNGFEGWWISHYQVHHLRRFWNRGDVLKPHQKEQPKGINSKLHRKISKHL